MITDDLIKRPGLWLAQGKRKGIVISSRVRLARNLRDHPFPGWAQEVERVHISEELRAALGHVPGLREASFFDMAKLEDVDREVLKERHLISYELAEKGVGSGLVVARDEQVAVMINEEDHLRLQAISPGLDLRSVWEQISAADSVLERHVRYAFSPRLGYLTACPTNVGTGLRASVMLHLSGLRLANEVEPVIKGLEKLGLAVRGILGEGTEAYGNMFQISNQATLGETEEAIIGYLIKIAEEVASHEEHARVRLLEERRTYLVDQVGRAFGILTNARLLTSQEAVDLLSGLRLGIELELVHGLSLDQVNEMMLLTQPGHLQKMAGRKIEPGERDIARADMIRERLLRVTISG